MTRLVESGSGKQRSGGARHWICVLSGEAARDLEARGFQVNREWKPGHTIC